MKTAKYHLSAIAFAILSVVAIYNSHNAIMLTRGTGDIYIQALNSESYQQMYRAFSDIQPPIL
jgi:hypothetical protein